MFRMAPKNPLCRKATSISIFRHSENMPFEDSLRKIKMSAYWLPEQESRTGAGRNTSSHKPLMRQITLLPNFRSFQRFSVVESITLATSEKSVLSSLCTSYHHPLTDLTTPPTIVLTSWHRLYHPFPSTTRTMTTSSPHHRTSRVAHFLPRWQCITIASRRQSRRVSP
jgi:hypothetical protein